MNRSGKQYRLHQPLYSQRPLIRLDGDARISKVPKTAATFECRRLWHLLQVRFVPTSRVSYYYCKQPSKHQIAQSGPQSVWSMCSASCAMKIDACLHHTCKMDHV